MMRDVGSNDTHGLQHQSLFLSRILGPERTSAPVDMRESVAPKRYLIA